MALESYSQEAIDRALEKLREKFRPLYPNARLVLAVDKREASPWSSHVIALEPGSRWYDALPPEQIVEIRDLTGAEQARWSAIGPNRERGK
jgi:hypothetical protein